MKNFTDIFEEVKQTDAELSVEDMGEISGIVDMLKSISDEDIESPDSVLDDIEYVLDSANLKFDRKKALKAFEDKADEVEIDLTSGDEDEGLSLNATNDEGEEVPGELVLCLKKDGNKMKTYMKVYFGDEAEELSDLDFEIPEDTETDHIEHEDGEPEERPLKSALGTEEEKDPSTEEDEEKEEDDEEDDDNKKDKEEDDTVDYDKEDDKDKDDEEDDEEKEKDELPPNVKKRGEIEIYEEYMGRTKYAVVHLKNGKLHADIFDHMMDIYNAGVNVVGEIIEVTPSEVHETQARMLELKKMRNQKDRQAREKYKIIKARKAAAIAEPISEITEEETDGVPDTFIINQNGVLTFDVYVKGTNIMQKRKNGPDAKIMDRTLLQQLIHSGLLKLETIPEPKYTMTPNVK